MTSLRLLALLATGWLGVASCATTAEPPAGTAPGALLRSIETEIGDADCDSDAQCHSLAIGAKACGGPEAYLAWSDKSSRASRLNELADQYRAARERENLRLGLRSDCSVATDPGAACRPRSGQDRRACQTGALGRPAVR